jgi:hypothetical protein
MNMNRRSHREDALFVIALLVPVIFASTRYVETDRQMAQIAQARAASVVAESQAPKHLVLAQAEVRGR